MPFITGVSIPLDVIENLWGHPRLAGIKDSENNPKRLEELLRRFGGQPSFSIFVGVGALMAKGLSATATVLEIAGPGSKGDPVQHGHDRTADAQVLRGAPGPG